MTDGDAEPVRWVVLCSGKIAWELAAETERDDVRIVRLEQLYPFPAAQLERVLAAHPTAEVVWCQEEPRNMGAWSFVERHLEAVLSAVGSTRAGPRYVGRPDNPSPSMGTTTEHEAEQRRIVRSALAP